MAKRRKVKASLKVPMQTAAPPFMSPMNAMPKPKVVPMSAPPAQAPRARLGIQGISNLAKAMKGRK